MLFSSLQTLTVFLSQLYFSACCFRQCPFFAAFDADHNFVASFFISFKEFADLQNLTVFVSQLYSSACCFRQPPSFCSFVNSFEELTALSVGVVVAVVVVEVVVVAVVVVVVVVVLVLLVVVVVVVVVTKAQAKHDRVSQPAVFLSLLLLAVPFFYSPRCRAKLFLQLCQLF